MKNALLKGAAYLFAPKAQGCADTMRFLCVSTTALGDTLWATPAIKALRETYPHSYIAVLTSPVGKEVLRYNPHINELFVVDKPVLSSLLSLYKPLKTRRFSHIFIFHTSQRPIVPFTALLGAKALIGSSGINKGLDSLLTVCLERAPKTHEIQRRLELVQTVHAHASLPEIELFLNAEDEALAEKWLHSLSLAQGPRIVLHPGATDAFRQWPSSHFIELGKRLIERGCTLFVTGIPKERALVEIIASHITGAIPVMHLPLRAFAAFVKRMHVMVTNDTGPLHVAFAMRTPAVALFAPSDPDRFGPYRAHKVTVLAKPATCTPCLSRQCPFPFCFLQIGVAEVYNAVGKWL